MDEPRSTRPRHGWMPRWGTALALAGAALYGATVLHSASIHWKLLALPLSLAPDTLTSPSFRIDLSTTYEIGIAASKTIPFDSLNCLLGIESLFPERCGGVPGVIDVAWEVTGADQGPVAGAAGPDGHGDGSWSKDEIERRIGSFHASRGSRCRVRLRINRDARVLERTHPKLVVSVNSSTVESAYFRDFISGSVAALLVLAGAVLWAIRGGIALGARRRARAS